VAQQLTDNAIHAAGGVLWRQSAAADSIEVAVIHRPRYDDWSLPKGKLNPGEIELEGAVREVMEETGYRVTVGRPLGEVSYLKDGRPKVVRYWAMRAEGGIFTPSREVDELRWLPISSATGAMTRPLDIEVLERFAGGPLETKAILLARHATAGNRSGWRGEDDDRPLDDNGREQADALVWLLTRFDIREIISAPPARCMQTVEPLSRAVGLTVSTADVLGEYSYYGREREALSLIRSAGTEGTGSVLCSQGGVIPDLLTRLAMEDGVSLGESVVAKKGSVWSLTFAEGRLAAAEYFPPLR
jgi:8-oxo-dGTP diphosphatase